jgi:AraC-like DNA-binding protein
LISCVPELNYFAKDEEGRFVMMDDGFVAMLGCKHRDQILGKTDYDFFPKAIAEKFVSDDRHVVATGTPIRDLTEPVPNIDMTFGWWLVNKVPLRNRKGKIVGVAGISKRLSAENAPSHYGMTMYAVLEHIGNHYGSRISVRELASIAGLSLRSFERNFFATFNTPPIRYLNRVRLQAARHRLVQTNQSLSLIAADCGFYDQSHMTAMFTRHFGVSPRRYRESRL